MPLVVLMRRWFYAARLSHSPTVYAAELLRRVVELPAAYAGFYAARLSHSPTVYAAVVLRRAVEPQPDSLCGGGFTLLDSVNPTAFSLQGVVGSEWLQATSYELQATS